MSASLRDLTSDELAAVYFNETDVLPDAGSYEVPAAIAELERRAEQPPAHGARVTGAITALERIHAAAEAARAVADEQDDQPDPWRVELTVPTPAAYERLKALLNDQPAEDLDVTIQRAGRDSDTDPTTSDDPARALLELNGYQTIRAELLGHAQAVANVPPEAIDAAVTFAERAMRRLRVSTNPQAADALERNDAELRLLRLVRTFRRELGKQAEQQAARARIVTP